MIPYRVTKLSELANASPTVALERGNYRMRAPGLRPRSLFQNHEGPAPPLRRQEPHSINRAITFLLFLLVTAVFISFGTAYYLCTKRWDKSSLRTVDLKLTPSLQVNASTPYNEQEKETRGEKYMTYLPHSGFHNQRIAFENALVLAHALRRTLLVPPIRLGNKPIHYVEYDVLVRHHELSSKDGLEHCIRSTPGVSTPMECLDYLESTSVPWTWLVDLSAISNVQRLVHLPNFSQRWIHQTLGLQEEDIKVLLDDSPYQFRFLDTDADASPPTDRYSQDVYLSDLATSEETLLQIGSLFGTSRLRLRDAVHKHYLQFIRKNMVIANQNLTAAASFIALALGNQFLSVHIRAGDGHFKHEASATINLVWRNLLWDIMGFDDATICDLARELTGKDVRECLIESPCPGGCLRPITAPPIRNPTGSSLRCRNPLHQNPAYGGLNVPLYVATDLPNPGIHPDLQLFRTSFPCIFFLDDFTERLFTLDLLRSPYDGVHLRPFLLPFVDGMVAAKASQFVGTEGSTFSKFVMKIWQNDHKIPRSNGGLII